MPITCKRLLIAMTILSIPAVTGLLLTRFRRNIISRRDPLQALGAVLIKEVDDPDDLDTIIDVAPPEHSREMVVHESSPRVVRTSELRERRAIDRQVIDYTTVYRLVGNLVNKCKLELNIIKHNEANVLVARRWFQKELNEMPDLRLKHKSMALPLCVEMVFVPNSHEVIAKKLIATRVIAERVEETGRRWFSYLHPSTHHILGRFVFGATASAV
jgi:hypothetical protein